MWIAREKGKNGELRLFGNKPIKVENKHFWGDEPIFDSHNTFGLCWPDKEGTFKKITFENSPQEVELIIKKNEKG